MSRQRANDASIITTWCYITVDEDAELTVCTADDGTKIAAVVTGYLTFFRSKQRWGVNLIEWSEYDKRWFTPTRPGDLAVYGWTGFKTKDEAIQRAIEERRKHVARLNAAARLCEETSSTYAVGGVC